MGATGEEIGKGQLSVIEQIKLMLAKKHELHQTVKTEVFKVLDEMEINSEKIEFIRGYIKALLELSFEHKKQVHTEWPMEEQLNAVDSTQGAIDQSILFCKDLLQDLTSIEEIETGNIDKRVKLKWHGTPSQFGYVFLELARQGFIEIPSTNGDSSYSRYARVCSELFSFEKETTPANLEKEMNPNKNTLSEAVRSKIAIPDIKDISKSKSRNV